MKPFSFQGVDFNGNVVTIFTATREEAQKLKDDADKSGAYKLTLTSRSVFF